MFKDACKYKYSLLIGHVHCYVIENLGGSVTLWMVGVFLPVCMC